MTYILFGAAATLLASGACFVAGFFIRLRNGLTPRNTVLNAPGGRQIVAGLILLAAAIVLVGAWLLLTSQ